MEEPRLFADHHGLYTIMPPKDMPLAIITMLQETIKEAWADYDGDPCNPEEFWAHLAMGEAVPTPDEVERRLQEAKSRIGAVDVPRETSSPANAHEALVELLRRERRPTEEEWSAYMENIRRRADADVPRETFDELLDQSTLGAPRVRAISEQYLRAPGTTPHEKMMAFLAESDRVIAEQGLDVPRETSAIRRPKQGEIWRMVTGPSDKVEIIFIGGTDRFGPDSVTYRHTNCPCRLQVHALQNHQSVRPMMSFLGLYEFDDVPRETTEGESWTSPK